MSLNDKIGNKTIYVKYITLNTKRHVWILRCWTIIYIYINELISEMIIACRYFVGFSTQSIWNINNPSKFSKLQLQVQYSLL